MMNNCKEEIGMNLNQTNRQVDEGNLTFSSSMYNGGGTFVESDGAIIPSPLLDLPDNLLLNIFRRLDACFQFNVVAVVCSRFKDVSYYARKRIFAGKSLKDSALSNVITECPFLKEVEFHCRTLSLIILNTLSSHCLFLTQISLIECKILINKLLIELCNKCLMIQGFVINRCFIGDRRLKSLEPLGNLTKLQNIRLIPSKNILCNIDAHWPLINNGMLIKIAENCSNLRDIEVTYGALVDNNFVISLLKSRGKSLHSLSLSAHNLTDQSLVNLNLCPNLEELKLIGLCQEKITTKTLCQVSNLANLKQLGISGMGLEPEMIIPMLKGHPNLVSLNLSSSLINDAGAIKISETCQLLQYLNLSGCMEVEGIGLIAITNKCTQLKGFAFSPSPWEEANHLLPYLLNLPELVFLHTVGGYDISEIYLCTLFDKLPNLLRVAYGFNNVTKMENGKLNVCKHKQDSSHRVFDIDGNLSDLNLWSLTL